MPVVADDGRGLDPVQVQALPGAGGFGLTSMRERVEAVGGHFALDSRPGAGIRVEARIPTKADP